MANTFRLALLSTRHTYEIRRLLFKTEFFAPVGKTNIQAQI
jgi:hypothetical protein